MLPEAMINAPPPSALVANPDPSLALPIPNSNYVITQHIRLV